MREFQGKRRFKKILYSRAAFCLLVLLGLLLGRSVAGVWWRSRGVEVERQTVAAELEALETRKRDLLQSIASLETDRGVEAELRSKFLVARPGEQVITVIYSEASSSATSTAGWWRRLGEFFK